LNWDCLGNISAAINHLQQVKSQVAQFMCANYQGSTHKDVNMSKLVWHMADTVQDLQLQEYVLDHKGQSSTKLVPDLHVVG